MTQEADHLRETIEGLQQRRDELAQQVAGASPLVNTTMHRTQIADLDAEIRAVTQRLVQIDDAFREEEQRRQLGIRMERFRAALDDAAFWLRRFCTTLGIGNAAAFAAVASGFLQSDERAAVAAPVANALTWFSAGMVVAGVMPLILFAIARADHDLAISTEKDISKLLQRKDRLIGATVVFALVSAGCLLQGFGFAIGGVRGLIPH